MTAEDVSTESAGLRRLVGIGQETWRSFSDDRAARLGASLAYYSVFALAPLLFLVIWLVGLIIGQETAQADLESRLESSSARISQPPSPSSFQKSRPRRSHRPFRSLASWSWFSVPPCYSEPGGVP